MERENLNTFQIDLNNFDEIMKETIPAPRRFFKFLPVGVSTSIIHTDYGALIQYIECAVNYGEKGDKLKTTGNIGSIITESTSIAYAYAKKFISSLGNTNFFEKNSIHLHFPAGAWKKDSSSLGAAIVSSLISLALQTPLKENIAIIGELTLSGAILHAYSIKEIFIELQREKITEVILPVANIPEYEELEISLKEGITVHFVESYQQIWPLISKSDIKDQQDIFEMDHQNDKENIVEQKLQ